MVFHNDSSTVKAADTVRLHLEGPGKPVQELQLDEGTSLTIGSHESCELVLPGSDVSAMHCVLKYLNGHLWIQDWNTRTGTLVDGMRISGETCLNHASMIHIGSYQIVADLGEGPLATTSARSDRTAAMQEVDDDLSIEELSEPGRPECLLEPDVGSNEFAQAEDDGNVSFTGRECEANQESTTVATEEEEEPLWDDSSDLLAEAVPDVKPTRVAKSRFLEDADNFSDETLDMYREEIARLQDALRRKSDELDGLRSERGAIVGQNGKPALAVEPSGRIAELTEELERTDERIANLEELLLIAEEASLAEQEERHQIESWIGEVEVRVGQRESELTAENEVLRRKVDEATAERNAVEQRLQNALSPEHTKQAVEESLSQIREQNSKLRKHLEQQQAKCASLDEEISRLKAQSDPAQFQQRVDEAIREERLQLAQERAALARQRVTIAKEVDKLPHEARAGGDAETRFQAFRQHLKEIHEQEVKERKEKSIGSRLASLWRRLE